MTRWLALDTSTWWGGVSLLEDREDGIEEVVSLRILVRDSHAARILVAVDRVLDIAGWRKGDLDAFAAVRGPGSFTGVRVGLGILRGLAVSSGRPCVGVDSLRAHAEAFGSSDAERVPLLDASRGEVYGARYDAACFPPQEVVPPWLGAPELALRGGEGRGVSFGSGANRFRARLEEAGVRLAEGPCPTGIATAAGRIASSLLSRGLASEADLAPLYLRPADAELGRRP